MPLQRITFDGDFLGLDCPIECLFEHVPEEIGRRENGVQMEPDYAEEMNLMECIVAGQIITPLLSEFTVQRLETKAIEEMV